MSHNTVDNSLNKLHLTRLLLIQFILLAIIAFGILESLWGWQQLLGFKRSMHSLYPVTGSFYNPGPYCGFLAMIIPLALGYILKNSNKILYWISYAYLLISIPLLPALMGRTGWLAAIIGCVYVLYKFKKIPRFNFKASLLAIVGVIILAGAIIYIKPTSALGRLLIWRNGLVAFCNNFLSGAGWDKVAGELGTAQEEYFASHPDSFFATVAGSPEYPFNEFLHIGIAFGILGLLTFIFILIASIRNSCKSKEYGITGSLIAFITVCLSSYPLQFPEFIIVVAILIITSFISNNRGSKLLTYSTAAILTVFAIYAYVTLNERKKESDNWSHLQYAYRYSLSGKDIKYLDSIAENQSWNAKLLFEYGKILRENGYYDKSNSILTQGLSKSSDPMFLNLIGRNYQDKGNGKKAEEFYLRSINRLPNRLYPYYLLAKLYADSATNNPKKFRSIYQTAIQLEPKINSPAIKEMKQELIQLNDSITSNTP